MSSLLSRIRETARNILGVKQGIGVVGKMEESMVKAKPEISMADLTKIYQRDSEARCCIDLFAGAVVGSGGYVTAEDKEAKNIIDNFNQENDLDNNLLIMARELVGWGCSWWEKVEPDRFNILKYLPISSLHRIQRKKDVSGVVISHEVVKIIQKLGAIERDIEPSRVILFSNVFDTSPFGLGLLYSLAVQRTYEENIGTEETPNWKTRIIPSLYEMKLQIENDSRRIMRRHLPRNAWIFDGAPDDWTSAQKTLIRQTEPGEAFVTNRHLEVLGDSIDPRTRFEPFLDYFANAYVLALQSPTARMFTKTGYTEASSRVVKEFFEWNITTAQRTLKRQLERSVFKPVVEQAGFDWKKSGVRWNWGLPEKLEVKLADIIQILGIQAQTGVEYMDRDEVRKILIKHGFELSQPEQPTQEGGI